MKTVKQEKMVHRKGWVLTFEVIYLVAMVFILLLNEILFGENVMFARQEVEPFILYYFFFEVLFILVVFAVLTSVLLDNLFLNFSFIDIYKNKIYMYFKYLCALIFSIGLTSKFYPYFVVANNQITLAIALIFPFFMVRTKLFNINLNSLFIFTFIFLYAQYEHYGLFVSNDLLKAILIIAAIFIIKEMFSLLFARVHAKKQFVFPITKWHLIKTVLYSHLMDFALFIFLTYSFSKTGFLTLNRFIDLIVLYLIYYVVVFIQLIQLHLSKINTKTEITERNYYF